jgi:hypothetical protein
MVSPDNFAGSLLKNSFKSETRAIQIYPGTGQSQEEPTPAAPIYAIHCGKGPSCKPTIGVD